MTTTTTRVYREEPRIDITLSFTVQDVELLRKLAKKQIKKNGGGHEYDPDNLADCLVELLLHSNPDIKAYLDYGVELTRTDLRNYGGFINQ